MSKKLKVIIVILTSILILWGIVFTIDYVRVSNLKMPIFVIQGEKVDLTLSLETYYGLGYKVETKKNLSNNNILKTEMYILNKFITGAISETNTNENSENNEINNIEVGRMIMVNGKLYYDTGEKSKLDSRCGTLDGHITSTVPEGEIPTKDDQANFKGCRGYQFAGKNTLELPVDNSWYIFKTKEDNENIL